MAISEKLGKEINSVLKANQLKMMEISGVDVKGLQAQHAETATKMEKIAKSIGAEFQKGAPAIAELHRKALISHYKFKAVRYPWRWCVPYPELDEVMDSYKSIELWPAEDTSHAKGEATCVVAENICRPYLELHGNGPGNPVSGIVTCGLVFCFRDVPKSGRYHFNALTQANGYRLLQLWGCGGCGGSVPTSGHLKITVRLCVTQPFDDWGPEYVLLDTTTIGPPAAIDLNRYVGHSADLSKDYDAFIKVEFKIDASIDGCGQSYVDLKTSDFFYFKVPEVTPCRSLLEEAVVELAAARRLRYIPPESVLERLEKYGLGPGFPELP